MKTKDNIKPSSDRDPGSARSVRDLLNALETMSPEERVALHDRPRPDPQKGIAAARRINLLNRWLFHCPPAARRSNWNHPKLQSNRANIELVRSWQPNPLGLLITGPTGRGKSRAFWSLLHRLMVRERRDVRVWQAHDFFYEIQGEMRFGRDESARFVEAMSAIPILALDDWGQEVVPYARENHCQGIFFQILDRRHGRGLPVIITTNLTSSDIAEGQDRKSVV